METRRHRLRTMAARPEIIVNNFLLAALVVLCIYFATQSSVFATSGNLKVILANNATVGVVAVALTLLLISGGVDLSIGSTVGLSGLIASLAAINWGFPEGAALVVGVLAGGAVGVVNGLLCGVFGFNPVIVTLGMLGVVRGGTLLIHHDQVFGLTGVLATLGNGNVFRFPVLALIALGTFALGALFIRLTTWGRYIYAIGSNRQAAFLAALPVRALPFALYVVMGLASGLAGVLLAGRLNGVAPGDQGLGLELQALTVVLLGGVAFNGGRGRLPGVFVGWIFLGVLQDGLILTNVTPFVTTLVQGGALVFAAALDTIGGALGARLGERRRVTERSEETSPHSTVVRPLNAGSADSTMANRDG
jgi:ribose/xylose/arabinose/galactoside ABC-type transport system permease subunit